MKGRSLRLIALCVSLAIAVGAGITSAAPRTQPEQPGGERIVVDGMIRAWASVPTNAVQAAAAPSLSESFEGTWPGPSWVVDDISDADGGEYMWGKRNCHPHSGTFGGWSAGGGAQGSRLKCSDSYPNGAHTRALYGPFDLRGATSASLTYHFWGRTEAASGCQTDLFFVGSSLDRSNFAGSGYCGDWTGGNAGNGYYQRTLDLADLLGQSQVWVIFVFLSDASVTGSGITIDDVSLDTIFPGPPTITPTFTPTPTQTASPPTPTQTASPPAPSVTATPVPAPALELRYLPLIVKQIPPAAAPSPSPEPAPSPTPEPIPSPTPTPGPERAGTWRGTTSQGKEVGFTIENNAFKTVTVGYSVPACGFSGSSTVFFSTPQPITGNEFTVQSSGFGPLATSFVLVGNFTSDTTASGNLQVTFSSSFPYTPCHGTANATWTAAKQ